MSDKDPLSMPLEVYSRQSELVFIRDSNGLVISKMPFGNKDEAALILAGNARLLLSRE